MSRNTPLSLQCQRCPAPLCVFSGSMHCCRLPRLGIPVAETSGISCWLLQLFSAFSILISGGPLRVRKQKCDSRVRSFVFSSGPLQHSLLCLDSTGCTKCENEFWWLILLRGPEELRLSACDVLLKDQLQSLSQIIVMLLGHEFSSCSAAANPCLQRCWLGTGVPCHGKGCEPEKRKWGLERLVLCLLAFICFQKI